MSDLSSDSKADQQIRQKIETETIDFFVRFMSLLGMPKSVGEIFGFLYVAPEPLSMEMIREKLGMSTGSASQGLKTLRNLKAIRTTYIMGDRKDYYIAETEFRQLLGNFIKEEVLPHLENSSERTVVLQSVISELNSEEERAFYNNRIERMRRLQKAASGVLPTFSKLLKL